MMFKLVEITKEIKNNPVLALDRVKDGIAIHANKDITAILQKAAAKTAKMKKINPVNIPVILENPIVHKTSYVLVEIWDRSQTKNYSIL